MPIAVDAQGRRYVPVNGQWVPEEQAQAPAQQPGGIVMGRARAPTPPAPPSGYTGDQNGLRPIPGGPADPSVQRAPTPLSEADRLAAAAKDEKARQSQETMAREASGALEALASARSLIGTPVRVGVGDVATGWFNGETGPIGAVMSGLSGTRAYDLKQRLAQVKAVLSTGKMAEMRANSPTGGAVGNPTPAEWDMLANTVANLDVGQSDEQLRAQLDQVDRHLRRMTGQERVSPPSRPAAPRAQSPQQRALASRFESDKRRIAELARRPAPPRARPNASKPISEMTDAELRALAGSR